MSKLSAQVGLSSFPFVEAAGVELRHYEHTRQLVDCAPDDRNALPQPMQKKQGAQTKLGRN
jgi:hypothetical protein